jgi:glutaredoxin
MEKKKKEVVKVYTAGHCTPCEDIKKMLEEGKFTVDGKEAEIDLVDIETDAGFEEATKRELTAVPSAFRGAKQCRIKIDDENKVVLLECEDEEKDGTPGDSAEAT